MSTTETGTIELRGRALENAQPGNPAQRQTVFEVARAVRGRATSEIEKAVVGIAAEANDFGHTPSSQPAVRDAYQAVTRALAALDATIDGTARTAVAAAENNDLFKDGRADRIDTAVHEADGALADAGGAVTGAADTLRATLEAEALPKVPTGEDHTAALSTVQALMSAASDKDKAQLFDRLAARDDSVAGWLLGPDGLEYARASFGREPGEGRHRSARLRALQAALERGNKHAVAARGVSDLVSAAGAYRAAWKSIRGNLVALSNDLRQQAAPQE